METNATWWALILFAVAAAIVGPPQPVRAAEKGAIRSYTDGGCLLADGFVDPQRIASAKEVSRSGGCVTLRDTKDVEFHVLAVELAKGVKVVCSKATTPPKAPTAAGLRAGAGEDC